MAAIAKKSGFNRFRCHDLAHAPRKIKGLCNGRENRMQAPAATLSRVHGIRVRNVHSRLRADARAPDQCAQAGAQKDHALKSSGSSLARHSSYNCRMESEKQTKTTVAGAKFWR